MNTTIACPIPCASQPKDPARLVDANSILRSIDMNGSAYDGSEYQAYKSGAEYVRGLIEDAPTIDPESLRPTAEWIEAPDEGADGSWEACSRCAWESRWAASQYKYCQHLAQRMVSADD